MTAVSPGDPSGPRGHGDAGAQEVPPEVSGPGSVVLDIGGNRGAAVVRTGAELAGLEMEIRPEPGEWVGEHVAVLPRELPSGLLHAAVFGSLPAGSYVVRVRHRPGSAELPLDVAGGRVTDAVWPS